MVSLIILPWVVWLESILKVEFSQKRFFSIKRKFTQNVGTHWNPSTTSLPDVFPTILPSLILNISHYFLLLLTISYYFLLFFTVSNYFSLFLVISTRKSFHSCVCNMSMQHMGIHLWPITFFLCLSSIGTTHNQAWVEKHRSVMGMTSLSVSSYRAMVTPHMFLNP